MGRLVSAVLRWGEKLLSNRVTSKLYPVEIVYPLLTSRLAGANLVADVQGSRMYLDSLDGLGLHRNGIYEPMETEFFRNEVKKGDVFVDIGANIGYYSLMASQLVGEEGKVFAFEPDPINCKLLWKNTKANGYVNIVIVQEAVSDKTGETRLFLCENRGDNRIYDSHDGRRSIVVPTTRLDDYFRDGSGRIDFVKMDIQGAEGGAIKGMLRVLKENQNVRMVTEFWPFALQLFGTDPEWLLHELMNIGFCLYEIKEDERKMTPVDISTLIETYTAEKKNYTNLLCVRS